MLDASLVVDATDQSLTTVARAEARAEVENKSCRLQKRLFLLALQKLFVLAKNPAAGVVTRENASLQLRSLQVVLMD